MTECIDLLNLLRAFRGKGIDNSEVYGIITRQVGYPSSLQPGVGLSKTGIFVEMSVFAVNLSYFDSFLRDNGIVSKDNIFMCRGTLVTYIESRAISGVDWYTLKGTLRLGSKDIQSNCVSVFNFYKDNNKWALEPCKVSDIELKLWDTHSAHYAWIKESSRVGAIKHPVEVMNLPAISSTYSKSSFQPKQQDTQTQTVQMPYKEKSVYNLVKENRQTIKDRSNNYDKFESILIKAKTSRTKFIDSLKTQYTNANIDSYFEYMLNALVENLRRKPSPQAMTGRMILTRYLDNFNGSGKKYMGGKTAGEYLAENFDDIVNFVRNKDCPVLADGIAWDLCKTAFGNDELFYAGVVSVILSLNFDSMQTLVETCVNNDLSIIEIMNTNPYLLQFLSDMSFNDIERIALCFNKHNDITLAKFKNVAMLNAHINDNDNGDTLFTKDGLYKAKIGIKISDSRYKRMQSCGTYLSDNQVINIRTYIKDVDSTELGYSTDGFITQGYNHIKPMSADALLQAIKDYTLSGLGVIDNNYITSTTLMNKELFVYQAMYDLGMRTFDYDSAEIDKYIAEYENIVGFKLEERQREAVHLLIHGGFIVAGSAGSGKTTVSNCIVYVLNHLDPMLDVQFAAPTGKAAKRMQEVVHKEVKTLHSKFKLGVESDNLFTKTSEESELGQVAFFFDEGAMITLDLLYKVLCKIDTKTSRVFLFGDFNQLPPIGKGLPFKNLLRFMPCVFLNVSKRAADGSNITRNSNYINEYSNNSNWQYLESSNDFLLLPCKTEDIPRVISDICKHLLGIASVNDVQYIFDYLKIPSFPSIQGLTPDDIQVVTPLAKESYKWGSISLNNTLQPLFNRNRNINMIFKYQSIPSLKGQNFVINDRVIHTDKNMYSMQWYSTYKDCQFQKIYGNGICNGEVGKIVDLVSADDCRFLDEVEQKPDDFEYVQNLRDDSTYFGENKYFVVVQYYDYISARNFYILYRTEDAMISNNDCSITLKGEDLSRLNLFYAGTTHKLQGSQAKVVICALGDVNYKGFITRQMIYTMVTRGENLVILVGSVENSVNSMLSKARCDVASSDVLTVGELLV